MTQTHPSLTLRRQVFSTTSTEFRWPVKMSPIKNVGLEDVKGEIKMILCGVQTMLI